MVAPRAASRSIPTSQPLRELEVLSRRYMQEMIPFVGPRIDVMAPDMGTNEQVMAWFMDTYSINQGQTVNEIVTGKPVSAGGTLGRREATGKGVAFLVGRALDSHRYAEPVARRPSCKVSATSARSALTRFAERGVRIVGISDHTAAYYDPNGFDIKTVQRHLDEAPAARLLEGEHHRSG